MNWYFAAAAALAFLVGLVHSVFGERLIFRRLRPGGVVPTNGGKLLGEGHVRIVWASWHIVTVFGWGFAAVLLHLAYGGTSARSDGFFEYAVIGATLAGSALVFFGTKARHPGWVGLLGIALLVWLGHSSAG